MDPNDRELIYETVARALSEDMGGGDVTAMLIPPKQRAHARVIVKERGVICGRAFYDGSIDPASALALAADAGSPC